MSNEIKTESTTAATADKPEVKDEKKKGGKGKFILAGVLTLVLAAGVVAGLHFYTRSVTYIITDNARVTTNIIPILSPLPGTLERYTVFEGRRVEEDEVIGWVEHVGPIRSPVAGIVVSSNAILNQVVSPLEPIAVIAETGRIHIQANIEETDILRISRGQPVSVTIDALGRERFDGYVAEVGLITQAELSGTALFFNTGGTFTRITHLIPVEIHLTDEVDLAHLIGVNARVQIQVR
ncbi:MAG: efflux RND transporter periplasmic adaptor subunit [Oscillospiraceae bacterium]|nr:efflux RND transporter periplasmic adaptor subunit [Oscillospiraceae bacterium]